VVGHRPARRADLVLRRGGTARPGDARDRLPAYRHRRARGRGHRNVRPARRPLHLLRDRPAIARIAKDARFFSYLTDTAATVDVEVGDGRLRLEDEPPGEFDLLILDAFSSDSIPVHLLTREALKMYESRLRPGGTLVIHVSNRIFDLKPVVAAGASELGLTTMAGRGGATGRADSNESEWLVLTQDDALESTLVEKGWTTLPGGDTHVWTDDYASILSALR